MFLPASLTARFEILSEPAVEIGCASKLGIAQDLMQLLKLRAVIALRADCA
jgi:hypothetical protein